MSDELAIFQPKVSEDAIRSLQRLANHFVPQIREAAKTDGAIVAAFRTAIAVKSLELAITKDMLDVFCFLKDHPLGFKTDEESRTNPKRYNGPLAPYSDQQLRRVCAHALLLGLDFANNEFNIIDAGLYVAKNGCRRRVMEFPGMTDFRETRVLGGFVDGATTAKVDWSASWRLKGQADEMKGELIVRINKGMGPDAALGKAYRKLLDRVYERLCFASYGSYPLSTPDGEVGEVIDIPSDPESTPKRLTAEYKASDRKAGGGPADVKTDDNKAPFDLEDPGPKFRIGDRVRAPDGEEFVVSEVAELAIRGQWASGPNKGFDVTTQKNDWDAMKTVRGAGR